MMKKVIMSLVAWLLVLPLGAQTWDSIPGYRPQISLPALDSTVVDSTKVRLSEETPITNQSLLLGGGNFFDKLGCGSYRYGEFRLLFGREKDSSITAGGLFLNYNDFRSLVDNYFYQGREFAFGPALNFGSRHWSKKKEIWGWVNLGLRFSFDNGSIDQYQSEQKDQMIYLFAGILFKNKLGGSPFFMQKIMVTYQQPFRKERVSSRENSPLSNPPTNKGYFQLKLENTFVSVPLIKKGTLRFEPKIIGSGAYRFYDKKLVTTLGLGLSLTRRYSQELISLEGGIKFNESLNGSVFYVGVSADLIQIGKALFQKKTTKK